MTPAAPGYLSDVADFTHLNLRRDVVDMAARHEMEGVEAHFATATWAWSGRP